MNHSHYFIRRLLLMIPTLFGIIIICFSLCQVLPGGPVEQIMSKMKGMGSGESAAGANASTGINQELIKDLEKKFNYDKPIYHRFWIWLVHDKVGMASYSFRYPNKTALKVISERIPVSLIFGLTGFLLSYLICIPLGILKGLKNGHPFDWISSVIVFIGFAIPAFSFGLILKMLFSGTVENMWDIFPVSGFESDNYDTLNSIDQIKDRAHHMFLPVLCYIIGNFAILTLMMKNSILEQISQDYIRTVVARGQGYHSAIWGHALRNSFIPIATGIGSFITLMFAGSVVIEQVFEIPGMGRLSLDAITNRDYPVFMAILTLTSLLTIIGNLISDFCYLVIDPRITFDKK